MGEIVGVCVCGDPTGREGDQCRHCWRVGADRDGCNCVLELTPPTHPEHPDSTHRRLIGTGAKERE